MGASGTVGRRGRRRGRCCRPVGTHATHAFLCCCATTLFSCVLCVQAARCRSPSASRERALGVCHDHPLLCEVVRVAFCVYAYYLTARPGDVRRLARPTFGCALLSASLDTLQELAPRVGSKSPPRPTAAVGPSLTRHPPSPRHATVRPPSSLAQPALRTWQVPWQT